LVDIATDYALNKRGIRVLFPEGTAHFSLLHSVQTGS
jgi:hypothetical protein